MVCKESVPQLLICLAPVSLFLICLQEAQLAEKTEVLLGDSPRKLKLNDSVGEAGPRIPLVSCQTCTMHAAPWGPTMYINSFITLSNRTQHVGRSNSNVIIQKQTVLHPLC